MTRHLLLASLVLLSCLLGAVIALTSYQPLANAHSSSVAVPPQWGTDIQVNPSPAVTPAAQRNFSIAIHPTNPNNLIAAYDSTGVHNTQNGYAWSTDAGQTWTNNNFWGPWGQQNLDPLGNGSMAFDSRGTAYYTALAVGPDVSGFFVLTSTNVPNWSTPVPIIVTSYDQYRSFPNLAVDHNPGSPHANRVYMFWLLSDNVSPYVHGIQLKYSDDGGNTWSS